MVAQYPTADVESVDGFKDTISAQFDPILYLIVVLLMLAVIIAFLGIANTIALSVLERTRELGLLRAVGMRRRQVRSTVRWESAIIALFGTVLGLGVGLLGGWGITRSLRDEGFEAFGSRSGRWPSSPCRRDPRPAGRAGAGLAGRPHERARRHQHGMSRRSR